MHSITTHSCQKVLAALNIPKCLNTAPFLLNATAITGNFDPTADTWIVAYIAACNAAIHRAGAPESNDLTKHGILCAFYCKPSKLGAKPSCLSRIKLAQRTFEPLFIQLC